MNIDDLTLGQIKEIKSFLDKDKPEYKNDIMLNKYVVVRCHDAGVHSGYLEKYFERGCVLTESRWIWYWKTLNVGGDFLSGIANNGLHEDSKVAESVERVILTENCQIIQCSDIAENSIKEIKIHGKV